MSGRMRRVNESVRAVVAEAVSDLKDPRIGLVTVTGVVVSPDLGEARIFVSVLGSEKKRAATLAGLESARGVLQARINRELSLRRTPMLAFAYDDAVERGVRMTKLIDELAADLPEEPDILEMTETTHTSELEAVAAAIRSNDRFLIVTHENPDGDALGSLLGTTLALRALDKDAVMYLAGSTALPAEYGFLELGDLQRDLPADLEERVLLAVDCANERRISEEPDAVTRAALVVDVDHHHDNTRFGDVNLIVADASSTAEIVRDVLRELGVELTPQIAQALYVALVTDTGRFQYSNTTPKSLRLAAELVEAGADVHGIFRHVYETVQFAKLKLLARALERAQLFEGGRLVVSYLLKSDFADVGAEEPYSEGIIDYLRAVEGSELVALIREPPRDEGPTRRVSLRSSRDEVDVSAIARKSDGGGHRQAAGFSSEESIADITDFIHREFVLATSATQGA
ncbi:MAG TPA: 30S ribosome-binding factor RbfA [Gaiellaceae bacterium]|nr:30S ribosome-binding factor RbfA [Gaiellaceae bacterium]